MNKTRWRFSTHSIFPSPTWKSSQNLRRVMQYTIYTHYRPPSSTRSFASAGVIFFLRSSFSTWWKRQVLMWSGFEIFLQSDPSGGPMLARAHNNDVVQIWQVTQFTSPRSVPPRSLNFATHQNCSSGTDKNSIWTAPERRFGWPWVTIRRIFSVGEIGFVALRCSDTMQTRYSIFCAFLNNTCE